LGKQQTYIEERNSPVPQIFCDARSLILKIGDTFMRTYTKSIASIYDKPGFDGDVMEGVSGQGLL
jgi:hypothetical protein